MTPLQNCLLGITIVAAICFVLSLWNLWRVYRPRWLRFSQRPTLRAPNIPVEFQRGEWETIP